MIRIRSAVASVVILSLFLPGFALAEKERDLQAAGGFFKFIGTTRTKLNYNNDFNVAAFVADQRPTADEVILYLLCLNVVANGSNRHLRKVRADGVGQSGSGEQQFGRRQGKFMQMMVGDVSPEADLLAPELEETYDFYAALLLWTINPFLFGPGSGSHSAYSLGVFFKGKESPDDLTSCVAFVGFGPWHEHFGFDLLSAPESAFKPLFGSVLPDLMSGIAERPDR